MFRAILQIAVGILLIVVGLSLASCGFDGGCEKTIFSDKCQRPMPNPPSKQ